MTITASTDAEDWKGPEEAAKYVGVSRRQLDRLRLRGEGPPYYQISEQARRYRTTDLDAWLESVRCAPSAS